MERTPSRRPSVVIAASRATETNAGIARALARQWIRARRVEPTALLQTRDDEVVLGRLDIAPGLDGIERGWWNLLELETAGRLVLNRGGALAMCHDKLVTALVLGREGIPQPLTALIQEGDDLPSLGWPVVAKPRFGSWGKGVTLLADRRGLDRYLRRARKEPWFRRQGVLLQEFVPNDCTDLRVIVALGVVAGAVARVAAPGEWRTNIALGGMRRRVVPPADACALALAAVRSSGADVAGVDLLRRPDGSLVVLELNGAVDFTSAYSLGGRDVFDVVAEQIALRLGEERVTARARARATKPGLPARTAPQPLRRERHVFVDRVHP